MANFLLRLLSTLALGIVAVQGAAVSQRVALDVRAQDASRPTRVASSPTRVEVTAPVSTVGESVYLTSTIPLNDVMDEGSVYTITVSNSRHSIITRIIFRFFNMAPFSCCVIKQ
jgi:hypothetical protein